MEAQLEVEEGPDAGQVFVVLPGRAWILGRRGDPGVTLGLRDPAIPPGAGVALRLEPTGLRAVEVGFPCGARLDSSPLAPRVVVDLHPGSALTIGASVVRLILLDVAAPRPAPPPEPTLPPGYEAPRLLGQGGAGKVFAAVRTSDRRPVAVKVLWGTFERGSRQTARFRREARLGRTLDSPFVTKVFDIGVHEGRQFMVMELVDGPSLDERIPTGGRPIAEALRVAEDVARGLAAAEALGIVHRDVKPSNVLLSLSERRAKLSDFGLARSLEQTVEALTATGQGLGTLVYMPPEQLEAARHVDARADLYSLGATLFHVIAGQPPFDIGSVLDLMRCAATPHPPLGALRRDCPPEVAALVDELLAKDPLDRPGSPALVAERLRDLRGSVCQGEDASAIFATI